MPSPADVRRIFESRIQSLLRDYNELVLAVHQKTRQASLETMLAEQTVMSLAVYWEAFLHDLLVTYVANQPTPCLNDFTKRISSSVADKFPAASKWVTVNFPDDLSSVQLERLLDPKGWNIVAKSAEGLKDIANRWLDAQDSRRFFLNADDAAFFDYIYAVRNYLGHRSGASRESLLRAMAAIRPNTPNDELSGTLQKVGIYLKRRTDSGTRVNSIGNRVLALASNLTS